ncbi:DUF881 domain-containing protein [Jatrophihabitans fulvus]
MTPSPTRRNGAPQLLLDLVENHLDPGYAAAAARRADRPSGGRRRLDTPLAAIGALVIGFLLVVAYVHTNRGAPEAQRVHDRLVERVRAAQAGADDLADDLDRVETDLDREQAAALPSGGALSRELTRAQLAAGELPVTGPGLRVTLSEPKNSGSSGAPQRGGSVPIGATHILTDRDVRAVVNELWRDGAEAIAVNGVRLTPTSAIRFAGEAVLVDFQPITSPYRIEAIGDADTLATDFAQSAVAARYQTRAGALGIGFGFANQSSLELPAASAVSPRYAVPAPSASSR